MFKAANENSNFFYVYVDGSANKRGEKMGSAWVIVSPNKKIIKGSAKLTPSLENPDKDIKNESGRRKAMVLHAEFFAVAAALTKIPENSKIRLHTDREDIAKIISDYDSWLAFNDHKTPYSKTRTKKAIDLIRSAVSRHGIVIAEVTNDRMTDNKTTRDLMISVHNAAARASGSKNIKSTAPSNLEALENTPITWPPKVNGSDPNP